MPAVNFAVGAFLEAWLCMFVFGGSLSRHTPCIVWNVAVCEWNGDERSIFLASPIEFLLSCRVPILYVCMKKTVETMEKVLLFTGFHEQFDIDEI